MDWKSVGSFIAKSAPVLGTALGGPIGGAMVGVVSLLAKTFGVTDEEVTPEQLIKAIELDPEAALKLKQFEMSHKTELERLVLENERIRLADVANAREREIQITQMTGKRDTNLYILAWTVVLGFFGLSVCLMKWPLPEGASEVVFVLFGAVATGFGTVLQYFFGSSRSSARKDVVLANRG